MTVIPIKMEKNNSVKRKIIATSGGFAIEPRNKRLDRYILSQSNSNNPKICFIPTASGDSENFIHRFYRFFEKEKCIPNHLSLFKGNVLNIREFILDQDIIYVGGGNTKNMLAIWREWSLEPILKKAYNQGILLCGISAGSLCWFEQGLTDSIPGPLTSLDCLGLLKGSNAPFFNTKPSKKDRYIELMESKVILPGIATEIGVGLHYENGQLIRLISSRKDARAFRYDFIEGEIREELLKPDYI